MIIDTILLHFISLIGCSLKLAKVKKPLGVCGIWGFYVGIHECWLDRLTARNKTKQMITNYLVEFLKKTNKKTRLKYICYVEQRYQINMK